jgi:hypothetical protein
MIRHERHNVLLGSPREAIVGRIPGAPSWVRKKYFNAIPIRLIECIERLKPGIKRLCFAEMVFCDEMRSSM